MFNQLKILSNKDITIINNDDEDYIFGALTVEGGGVFKKGIALGIQERMVPGLVMYDNENFYGFSEKHGLCLLSTHQEYNELVIPENVFLNKDERNTLQPLSKNVSENFQNLKETDKIENKNLNIEIHLKESNNFNIIIPENYNINKFILTFDILFIYDLNSIISSLSLVLINRSNRPAFFKIVNTNCYFEDNFTNDIDKNSAIKIHLEVINNNCFIIKKSTFRSS